jgi:hypothetical protein
VASKVGSKISSNLYRIRSSPSSLRLIEGGTSAFDERLAQLNLNFHVLFSECLQVYLSTLPVEYDSFSTESIYIVGAFNAMILIVGPHDPEFMPESPASRYNVAELQYFKARRMRLNLEHSVDPEVKYAEELLLEIREASASWPENEIIREEIVATEKWMGELAQYRAWKEANGISECPYMADWRKKVLNGPQKQ